MICSCGSPYGLSVGWTQPGEWLDYTVTVASYGAYKFQTLTATIVTGSALHVEVDGVDVTGPMILPNTGAWGSYATTSSPAVTLTAGQHTVRVAVNAGGFLIDSVDLIRLNTPYGGTPANIPILATAGDADGTVSKVEFFQGSAKIGEALTEPHNFTWTNVTAGTYNLTAKATDNLGGSTPSASVSFTVNALPSVSLTAPTNGAVFTAPANMTLTASASDADGSITKVQFFQGATLLNEDTSAPYSFNWNSVTAGNHNLTARAFDNLGGTKTSAVVAVVVTNAPATSITSPLNNATLLAGANIIINANASDSDGSIAKVKFFKDGVLLGEDTTSPYSFTWNNVPTGTYALTTRATDGSAVTRPTTTC